VYGSTRLTIGAHERSDAKPCLHDRHVGTCPHCQRAQLARWNSQLLDSAASPGVLVPVPPGPGESPQVS
jgi:hypothetical protein